MAHEGSGTAHKVISVILRLTEFCSAIIVLGILSRFAYYIEFAGAGATVDGRIIYTLVVAGISILYSMFFCVPLTFLFMSFPFDLILWIMWLVAFSLLASVRLPLTASGYEVMLIHCEQRTSSGTCSSRWYYNYWGYYWGRYWRVGPVGTVNINGVGCSQWRTALAFSFISSFVHLMSGILVSLLVVKCCMRLNYANPLVGRLRLPNLCSRQGVHK